MKELALKVAAGVAVAALSYAALRWGVRALLSVGYVDAALSAGAGFYAGWKLAAWEIQRAVDKVKAAVK